MPGQLLSPHLKKILVRYNDLVKIGHLPEFHLRKLLIRSAVHVVVSGYGPCFVSRPGNQCSLCMASFLRSQITSLSFFDSA